MSERHWFVREVFREWRRQRAGDHSLCIRWVDLEGYPPQLDRIADHRLPDHRSFPADITLRLSWSRWFVEYTAEERAAKIPHLVREHVTRYAHPRTV